MPRCEYIVHRASTYTMEIINRKCLKNSKFSIENHKYCHIHANIIYKKYVTYIQKIYRGHFYRNKLNVLFKPLPKDLQQIVLFYMRQNHYYKKYCNTIQNILSKKYDNLLNIGFPVGLMMENPIHYATINQVYNAFINCMKCCDWYLSKKLYLFSKNYRYYFINYPEILELFRNYQAAYISVFSLHYLKNF